MLSIWSCPKICHLVKGLGLTLDVMIPSLNDFDEEDF